MRRRSIYRPLASLDLSAKQGQEQIQGNYPITMLEFTIRLLHGPSPNGIRHAPTFANYLTLLSKNNPTAETVTKQEREGLLLSKLSTLNHSRHGSARESAVTSSPEEMTSSQTFRTTKPGIGQMPTQILMPQCQRKKCLRA